MKYNEKIFQIAEEIAFVKVLSSNDLHSRNRALKKLNRWIAAKSHNPKTAFTDDDFIRLWEGLFFSMWMSDKPLIQEECAEKISNLIHSFATEDSALSFIRSFFHIMCNKWSTIDVFRLDKFAMLVRRIIRQSLVLSKKHNWNDKLPQEISIFINKSNLPQGLFFHFCDIFIEEICKIAGKDINDDILIPFMKPFFKKLAETKDRPLASYMIESVIKHFIDLTDVADEYREKFRVWQNSGFKGGRISVLEEVDPGSDDGDDDNLIDEDDTEDPNLDPRPGRVDVVLPVIKINPDRYIQVLEDVKKELNKKSANLYNLFTKFYSVKRGEYPYGIKKVRKGPNLKDKINSAVEEMVKEHLGEEDSSEEKDGVEKEDEKNNLKRKRKDKYEPVNLDDLGDIVAGKRGRWNITNVKDKKKPSTSNIQIVNNINKQILRDWKVIDIKNEINKKQSPRSKGEVHTTDTVQQWKMEPTTLDKSSDQKKIKQNLNLLKDAGECWWRVLPLDGQPTQKKNKKKVQPVIVDDEEESDSSECSVDLDEDTSSPKCSSVTYNGYPINSIVTVPNKLKHIKSSKQDTIVYPSMKTKEEIPVEKTGKKTPSKVQNPRVSELKTPGTTKRLSIRLDMNTSQDVDEHFATLASNPEVPFDANKKPIQGVLKPSPIPSPINPFYGKRKNRSLLF